MQAMSELTHIGPDGTPRMVDVSAKPVTARRALAEAVDELIEVSVDEARRFACNAVVLGGRVITNTGCDELHAALRARGFDPYGTPLDEFVKAGGSAKCLTLRLDGEDAASWKYEKRVEA